MYSNRLKGLARVFFVICLLTVLPLASSAQEMTVRVDTVGQLASKLTDDIRFTMSELKVCGPLNGNDFRILQTIAGRAKPKRASGHKLLVLDLSEVTIPENKGGFRTHEDVLPAALFINCRDLEHVILPSSLVEIGRSCFSGCVNLKTVTLPQTLTIIGEYACRTSPCPHH